ncbi:CPBP family intramembrane glutamic endopeptidase [Rhodovulum sp. DZ06]|uniref:CPBP family intramembrane glutamic endopeptidase n=1 Tax=Rhodovulum sp. DZ06 TaxID=3425126 RepID=UPI003D3491A7
MAGGAGAMNMDRGGGGQAPAAAFGGLGGRARAVLGAEFAALYLGMPLALAFLLPASAMWPVMFAALAFALFLLRRAEGFRWLERIHPPTVRGWVWTLAVGVATMGASLAAMAALRPEALFGLPIHMPRTWVMVMLLYPLVSALPQEVLFRTLFFERYAPLFPSRAWAVAANGAVFGLAHLFLNNWIAVVLSGLGGALFALAYLEAGPKRGLLTVSAMHGIAGCALFTAGMGVFFYHGMAAP